MYTDQNNRRDAQHTDIESYNNNNTCIQKKKELYIGVIKSCIVNRYYVIPRATEHQSYKP